MIFDVVTIFPGFLRSMLEYGLFKRALEGGQVEVRLHDLRDFTDDVHRTVDDRPFGGGPGMVFKPEPIFRAIDAISAETAGVFPVILLSPQGRLLRQGAVEHLVNASCAAQPARIALICGRYEGVDNRVGEALATDELSIGDYILSGGELAAAVVMECCTRLLPGVMGNEASGEEESFSFDLSRGMTGSAQSGGHATQAGTTGTTSPPSRWPCGLLGFPQYTRPAQFRGLAVPEVLLSGNHQEIRRWRRRQALERTWRRRPDLLEGCVFSQEDRQVLAELSGTTG
jgi:tRNA (guanine37-N1)-methyltransferase